MTKVCSPVAPGGRSQPASPKEQERGATPHRGGRYALTLSDYRDGYRWHIVSRDGNDERPWVYRFNDQRWADLTLALLNGWGARRAAAMARGG